MSVESSYTSEDGTIACSLTFIPLDVAQVTKWVGADEAGASALFVGTTRNSFQGKRVTRLEYEGYSKLAMRTMIDILEEARRMTDNMNHKTPSHAPVTSNFHYANGNKKKVNGHIHHNDCSAINGHSDAHNVTATIPPATSLLKLAIHHRLGTVPVGEPSIIIAVSSPHRKEAFVACEWVLEEVKSRVQVWKKEVYDTSSTMQVVEADGMYKTIEIEESEWKANAVYPRTS